MGETLWVLPETTSTMSAVDALIGKGCTRKTVIALRQTAGRGTDDVAAGTTRKWWSGEGNLMFSSIVNIKGYAREAEFIAALAVAEIIADLLPNKAVELKYPNDVLVNGAKICGCLVVTDDKNYYSAAEQRITFGVGVNLAATPPSSAFREKATVQDATCLKAHKVNRSIADFMPLFDEKFNEVMNEYRKQGFVYVLQRIGFADSDGKICLCRRTTGECVKGAYSGLSTEKRDNGFYVNKLLLDTGESKPNILPLGEYYAATARIKSPLRKNLSASSTGRYVRNHG